MPLLWAAASVAILSTMLLLAVWVKPAYALDRLIPVAIVPTVISFELSRKQRFRCQLSFHTSGFVASGCA